LTNKAIFQKVISIKPFGGKMTREQMIDFIAKKAEITKKQAGIALRATTDGIIEALQAGEKVTFIGFGTFKVAPRKARTGINPQTKKKIKIAARKVPVFRASAKLKAVIKKVK
jgi:nucleoid DNA-binding protein